METKLNKGWQENQSISIRKYFENKTYIISGTLWLIVIEVFIKKELIFLRWGPNIENINVENS